MAKDWRGIAALDREATALARELPRTCSRLDTRNYAYACHASQLLTPCNYAYANHLRSRLD